MRHLTEKKQSLTEWKKELQDRYDALAERLEKQNPNKGCEMDETTATIDAATEPVISAKKVKRAYIISDDEKARRANRMKAYWAKRKAA